MTDDDKLIGLIAILRSFTYMFEEKRIDPSNWPRFTLQQLQQNVDECWRDMYLLILTSHYEAIEDLLKQNNIVHYGC